MTKGGMVARCWGGRYSTRETYFLIRALTKGGMVAEWQILYKGNIIENMRYKCGWRGGRVADSLQGKKTFSVGQMTKGGMVARWRGGRYSTRETYFLIRALTKGGMVAEWQIQGNNSTREKFYQQDR